ncbi:MAG: hypothetical protein KDJ65_20670 [Anaerolineae bacterium]|nr:hypothetical protein [Anaerolineae bacterium]
MKLPLYSRLRLSIHGQHRGFKSLFRPLILLTAVIGGLAGVLLTMQLLHYFALTARANTNRPSHFLTTELNSQPSFNNALSYPIYSTATVLLEDVGGNTVALSSVLDELRYISILKEGSTYYLWLNSTRTNPRPRSGIEQRLESQDGLIWSNRTDTDLVLPNNDSYKFLEGLRSIIKKDNTYHAWESYYYEWSLGWGHSVRYVTSTNGINWTVVNQPSNIGTVHHSVIEDGDVYHMWARIEIDNRLYPNEPEIVRYRTNTNPGSGWSHWRTGGTPVTVDGEVLGSINRVRQARDTTNYELFYIDDNQMHLATSANGITFTTQISNILDLDNVLPDMQNLYDFLVVDVEGEDWFYFTYKDAAEVFHIAVSRPIAPPAPPDNYAVYLPAILRQSTSPTNFPIHIGNGIARRNILYQGEVFYSTSVQIPDQLPAGGHFYFSSKANAVAPARIDDKLIMRMGNNTLLTYNFSTNGTPASAVVEVPRTTMQQVAGKTVKIEYQDIYAGYVEATPLWLIWSP